MRARSVLQLLDSDLTIVTFAEDAGDGELYLTEGKNGGVYRLHTAE